MFLLEGKSRMVMKNLYVNIVFFYSLNLTAKISQTLSPKHVARGVAQSPYPIYSHKKNYLSKHLQ